MAILLNKHVNRMCLATPDEDLETSWAKLLKSDKALLKSYLSSKDNMDTESKSGFYAFHPSKTISQTLGLDPIRF